MKNFVLILVFLLPLVHLNSKVCEFSFNQEETSIGWTAFKFTEKAGVGGKFDKVVVLGNPKAGNVADFARKVKFIIPISGINTKNPERDEKIKKYFFGEMKATSKIRGFFRNVKFDGKSVSAELILKMNNQERSIAVTFSLDENKNL